MKKLKLLSITLVLCALAAFTAFPASALENDDTGLGDALEVERVEDSVPESAGEILNSPKISDSGDYSGALRQIWDFVKEHGGQAVKNVMRSAVLILFITVLCSAVGAFVQGKHDYTVTAGVAAISVITVTDTASFMNLGVAALSEISVFSKALLPTLASAAAMSGAYTSASAKYAVSVLFVDILMGVGENVVVPLIYAYVAAGIASAAIGGQSLEAAVNFLKWLTVTLMTAIVVVFTTFLSITGIISGGNDAALQKVAKTAISTALPVVGGIISDAAGTVTAGASILRNSVGVFGLIIVLAVCITPVLKIGAGYLLYKASAGIACAGADGRIVKLLNTIGTAFGMILGLVGASGVMFFVSVISAIKTVT